MTLNSVQDLARDFVAADEDVRVLEEKLKAAKKTRDGMRDQLVDEMLYAEAPSVEVFAPDGGRARVYPINRLFARRNKDADEGAFLDALREQGYEHLIKESVNTNSLSAIVREMADEANVRDATASVIAEALPGKLGEVLKVDTTLTLGIKRV